MLHWLQFMHIIFSHLFKFLFFHQCRLFAGVSLSVLLSFILFFFILSHFILFFLSLCCAFLVVGFCFFFFFIYFNLIVIISVVPFDWMAWIHRYESPSLVYLVELVFLMIIKYLIFKNFLGTFASKRQYESKRFLFRHFSSRFYSNFLWVFHICNGWRLYWKFLFVENAVRWHFFSLITIV